MKKIPIRLLGLIVALLLALSAAAALSSCANSGQVDDTTAPQAITNSDVTTAAEETELVTSEETGELIRKVRSFGYTFALDDFSMGHTSLQYLQPASTTAERR